MIRDYQYYSSKESAGFPVVLLDEKDFMLYSEVIIDSVHDSSCIVDGSPKRYPCLALTGDIWDNPNGPYEFEPTFIYLEDILPLMKLISLDKLAEMKEVEE